MLPKLSGPIHKPASGGKPRQLVVLLHGLGADGNDLIGLAPVLFGTAAALAANGSSLTRRSSQNSVVVSIGSDSGRVSSSSCSWSEIIACVPSRNPPPGRLAMGKCNK